MQEELTSIYFTSRNSLVIDGEVIGWQKISIYFKQKKLKQEFYSPDIDSARMSFVMREYSFSPAQAKSLKQFLLDADCLHWHEQNYDDGSDNHWDVAMRKVKGANVHGTGTPSQGMLAVEEILNERLETIYPLMLYVPTKVTDEEEKWLKDVYQQSILGYQTYVKQQNQEMDEEEQAIEITKYWLAEMAVNWAWAECELDEDQAAQAFGMFLIKYLTRNTDFNGDNLNAAFRFGYEEFDSILDESGFYSEDLLKIIKIGLDYGDTLEVTYLSEIPLIIQSLAVGYQAHCEDTGIPEKRKPQRQIGQAIDFSKLKKKKRKKRRK